MCLHNVDVCQNPFLLRSPSKIEYGDLRSGWLTVAMFILVFYPC